MTSDSSRNVAWTSRPSNTARAAGRRESSGGTPKPLRLAILGASPCHLCDAACCKQNGHEYAAILRGDEVRKFAAFSVDARIEAEGRIVIEKVLPYRDGRCQFLGEDDRCTIYQDRPAACRSFECSWRFNADGIGEHEEFLQRNPGVLRMLQTL